LAHAVQKRAIYPVGHPLLQGAVERLCGRIRNALTARSEISLGIARNQVIIEGVAADERHALLRELAEHLHGHQVAALRILPGVEPPELDDFLGVVAQSALRVDRPLGLLEPAERSRWKHLVLCPVSFDHLEMLDKEETADREAEARAAELWLGLAQAALAYDEDVTDWACEPEKVADAINSHASENAYDQAVLGYLLQTAEVLTPQSGKPAEVLRKRISRTIRALRPEALRRILEMGGDRGQRRRFAARCVDALSAGAVLDILDAMSDTPEGAISASMMRLLRKLARNAESTSPHASEADKTLRRHVSNMLSEWTLADPNPETYSEVLSGIAQGAGGLREDRRRDVAEPERVLEIALDAEAIGADAEVALSRLVVRDGLAAVIERLNAAPPTPAREMLLDRLVNAAVLREQLNDVRPDVRLLRHSVQRLRHEALDPLIAALETRDSRDATWLVELLILIGPDAAPALGAAFTRAQPSSQRSLLNVLERWNVWPPGLDLLSVARHPDPSMRRVALRVLQQSDGTRREAVLIGLRDPNERIFAQALSAALKAPMREALGPLRERAVDSSLSEELRLRAIRCLAACEDPEAMHWLIGQVVKRHWLTGGLRLRGKSPMTMAAIAGLAMHWRSAPEAAQVLALAASHKDPGLRRASAIVEAQP
jgi:hypothetical protein